MSTKHDVVRAAGAPDSGWFFGVTAGLVNNSETAVIPSSASQTGGGADQDTAATARLRAAAGP